MQTYIKYFLLAVILTGCYSRFPFDKDVTRTQHEFYNQDSVKVKFPEVVKDKIFLMTMIYTHCPDICPMTTHNMQLVEDELTEEELENVEFVVISFDPNRDTPSIMQQYAEIRNMDPERWNLLTGKMDQTEEVMTKFDIKAIPTDSSYSDDGEISYYIMHTDRISLVDSEGKLKNIYSGSNADIKKIVNDIRYLEE